MRLLVFTLLAIAIGVGIQMGLGEVPGTIAVTMHGIIAALIFMLPMIATTALAYAMRISNLLYVFFAVILSPFVSFALLVYVGVAFLHDHLL